MTAHEYLFINFFKTGGSMGELAWLEVMPDVDRLKENSSTVQQFVS
ncbi:hypothetical protein [Rhodohalobacter sp. 8-1]